MNMETNQKIKDQVLKMLDSDRTVHAFMFSGGSSDSRYEMGIWLCRRALCVDEVSEKKFDHGNHEDFITVTKPDDKESIVKDQILELNKKLEFKPYGDRYAVLIKDAHLMNEIAQNKLLKSLEEPVSQAVFVLLSERDDALLQTIRSRCSCFHLEEEKTVSSEDNINAASEAAKLIALGSAYYKKKQLISHILADKDDQRNSGLEYLDCLEDKLEEYMLSGNKKAMAAIAHVETARKYLKQGHSVPYTLKQMMLRV